MSQAMRKLTSVISKSNCVAIFINQVREKIGVIYGNPETTPGGRALKFYSSVRIEVRKGEAIKVGSEIVGNRTKCKVVKNKVSPPFKEAEFDMLFGKGISRTGEVVDIATDLGIIKKSGAWFSYNGNKIGQGRENTKKWLAENPETMKEIEAQIKEKSAEVVLVSKKSKKEAAVQDAAAEAESYADEVYEEEVIDETPEEAVPEEVPEKKTKGKKSAVDVIIDADDDFEEFTPVK